ncbi:AraC family transcriptional regulator [Flavihumibacter rivuli]|uniref:AraC family transcriptional regulator n=1 Tax=Flavihumibacter rivuli TaxID=2838156 RepID=UPI001BDDF86F|nr:AraC family transcriptional regulator [Flavihumibacter rivuli]ULQ55223.1 AraC family transcriptional regulator [Flavihumibacter rivuli]
MKIEQTEITPRINSYVTAFRREEPFFQSPFHFHPELELVYVQESFGKRIIGNVVEPFEARDMVFLGSNIPHVWLNDETYYQGLSNLKARAIVVYFNKEIFGPLFFELNETRKINALFQQAERGLRISGKTQSIIAKKLEKLVDKKDFDQLLGLLEILNLLAESKDVQAINPEAYSASVSHAQTDRLSEVFKYVKANFREDITLTDIAAIANLTPQSFCRLFKKRTNKHFVEYLNEVRVSNACSMLLKSDRSISEIAYECGYKTLSNFNKLFKKITGKTPKEYKRDAE